MTNIGMLTFLLPFSRQEIHKKSTKNFIVLWLKLHWSKTHEIKSKFKFNLYFNFEIINIHNRLCKKFFLSLTHFFITATYWRFSTGPEQARKQYALTKTRFSFKIKDWIILFELEGILKNNLRLFKLDSKTLLVYHCTITSTKWRNMKVTPSF